MAKFRSEFEKGIVKHTLTFRGKDFDYSVIPTESGGSISDKSCFSKQLADEFSDLEEDILEIDVDVDMLGNSFPDEDEIFEILDKLGEFE